MENDRLGYESQEVRQRQIISIEEASVPTVTNFNDLCRYKEGNIVELPPFAQGQPFVARMSRPSLMVMLKNGKIPNQLMKTASKLFDGTEDIGDAMFDDSEAMSNMYSIMEIICEASLIEPTYNQIKEFVAKQRG